MRTSPLDRTIKEILEGKAGREGSQMDFAGDPSAIEKAKIVLNEVNTRHWDTKRVAFVSIGGADGTELDYELRETSSSHGVLLEWDDALSKIAYEKEAALRQLNKQMQICTGDAREKIKAALAWIDTWKSNKEINCMVVTMFAILHEFPYRGNRSRELVPFLMELNKKDIGVLIIAREPFMPTNLPEFLTLSGRCEASHLASLANRIREQHPELTVLPEAKLVAKGARMPARLAIDTILKLPNLKSFRYELEELATAFTEEQYLKAFRCVFGQAAVRDIAMQSDTYDKLWRDYELQLTDDNSAPLGKPRSHLGLVVQVSKPPADTPVRTSGPRHYEKITSFVKGELLCVFDKLHRQQRPVTLSPNVWHCPGQDEKYSCLTVCYDYSSIQQFPLHRKRGLHRYLPLLPINEVPFSLNEGSTALFSNKFLSEQFGVADLYFKDEGRNPTGSFKDRKAIIDTNYAVATNATCVHCLSSGNAGISLATYARIAGISSKIYLMNNRRSLRQESKHIGRLGGQIFRDPDTHKIPLTLDHASKEYNCTPGYDPIGMEGYKVIAWEIWEDLGRVPDVVVVPVGSGEGLFGIFKGFSDLKSTNRANTIPRMLGVEPSECGILSKTHSWKNDPYVISDTDPNLIWKSHADQLVLQFMPCIRLVLWAIEQSGGMYMAVSNAEIEESLDLFFKNTGLMIEPSSAAVLAALRRKEFKHDPKETIVAILTGRGDRYVYETLQFAESRKMQPTVCVPVGNKSVYIHRAGLTDYKDILPLYNDLIKTGDSTLSVSPIFVDDEAMFFAGLGGRESVFVVRQQDALVGYGLLLEYRRDLNCSPHVAEVDMYFWPQDRDLPVEKALLKELIDHAIEKGYQKAVHECRSADDIKVYRESGFKPFADLDGFYMRGSRVDKILILQLPNLQQKA